MDENIGFGFYQSCENRESAGRVSVVGLRWCRWEVGMGRIGVGRFYVCVSCESEFFV